MSEWIKATGRILQAGGSLKMVFNTDLNGLYQWLLDRHFCLKTHLPAHGGHVSIWLPSKHRSWTKEDQMIIRPYLGSIVEFEYNPYIRVGGFSKPYRNFIMDVRSEKLTEISDKLGISQNFHITVSNSKGGFRPYIVK